MLDVKSGSAHVNVRHILKLSGYLFHTFSAVVVKHRKCYVAVKVTSVKLLIVLMKVLT